MQYKIVRSGIGHDAPLGRGASLVYVVEFQTKCVEPAAVLALKEAFDDFFRSLVPTNRNDVCSGITPHAINGKFVVLVTYTSMKKIKYNDVIEAAADHINKTIPQLALFAEALDRVPL